MNRSLYRLIFNAARGQVMAVAEVAASHSGGDSSGGETPRQKRRASRRTTGPGPSHSVPTFLRKSLVSLCAVLTAFPQGTLQWANAQTTTVIADPTAAANKQAQIFNSANGTVQVNIQGPSVSGVSHNVYRQFDVGSKGVILNNATRAAQTQLGGWVQANGNLGGTSARLILNEVNSNRASQLAGFVEVAGSKAEVVIANAAGIAVSGGGFINASAVTLTTGTPIVNSGNLEGYRVTTGAVSIGGSGLDTSSADYTRILARAVDVNAGIWAKDLKVVTGAHQSNADASAITPISAAPGASTPTYGLDVAALGGMYAGKITLIGTEAGLGVNNAGTIAASGNLVLQSNGQLVNRSVMDGQTTHIAVNDLQNIGTGRIYGDHVAIQVNMLNNAPETVDGVTSAPVIAARERLDIAVSGTLTNGLNALLYSDGDMAIGGSLDASTLRATGSAGTIENAGGTIEAAGALYASAAYIRNTNPNFAYDIRNSGNTDGAEYFTSGGTIRGDEVGWILQEGTLRGAGAGGGVVYSGGKGRLIKASHDYGNKKYQPYYNSANAFTDAYDESVSSCGPEGCDSSVVHHTESFAYTASDSIWSVFKVTPPTSANPGLRPVGPTSCDGDGNCSTEPADPAALAAWQVASAPWIELQSKLDTFRNSVNAAALTINAWRTYTQTNPVAVVTTNTPGQILSGGNMTLNATQQLLNDQSKIVAGGTLTVSGAALTNASISTSADSVRTGTTNYWYHFDKNCGDWLHGCDYNYDAYRQTGYNEAVPQTLTLSTSSTLVGTKPSTNNASAVPQSSFFKAANTAASYVVETDPRFTKSRQWLSSDYMLSSLGLDPAGTQKRLGDGFYEQRLVHEQLADLTGRRFLDNYSNDETQYRALMTAGTAYAKAHNLRPGLALSAEQMAGLSTDMVWLVERTVNLPDGTAQKVLAPQVYLAASHLNMAVAQGQALISANNINVQLSGQLSSSGRIQAVQVASLQADSIRLLSGNSEGTADVKATQVNLTANKDIELVGASVEASRSMTVQAGRDVVLTTTMASGSSADGLHSVTQIDRVAQLKVTGDPSAGASRTRQRSDTQPNREREGNREEGRDRDRDHAHDHHHDHDDDHNQNPNHNSPATGTLTITAGRDLALNGAVVQSSGSTQLLAGNNIAFNAVHESSRDQVGDGTQMLQDSMSRDVGSRVTAGGDLQVSAANNVTGTAAQLQSQGKTQLEAGNNVAMAEGRDERSHTQRWESKSYGSTFGAATTTSTQIQVQAQSNTAIAGIISGAQGVTIQAGGGVQLTGQQVQSSGGDVSLSGSEVLITAAKSTASFSFRQDERTDTMGLGKSTGAQSSSSTSTWSGTQVAAGGNVNIATTDAQGQGVQVLASTVQAGNDLNIDSAAGVRVISQKNVSQSEQHTQSNDDIYAKAHAEGRYQETAASASLSAGRNLSVTASGEQGDMTVVGADLQAGQTLSLGGNTVQRDERGLARRDQEGRYVDASGTALQNLNVSSMELVEKSYSQDSSGYAGIAKELIKLAAQNTTAATAQDVSVDMGSASKTSRETRRAATTNMSANNLVINAQKDVNLQGVAIDVAGAAQIDADNILISGVQESDSTSSSTSKQTFASTGIKLQSDRIQVSGTKDEDISNEHSETTTSIKSAAMHAGNLSLNARKNVQLLAVDATVDGDLDVQAGTSVVVGGLKGKTTTTDKTVTKTSESSVGIRNAYLDAVNSVLTLEKAKQAMEDAKKALDNAQGRVDRGELAPNALNDYKTNLAAATVNLTTATLGVIKAIAMAAATSATFGFTADMSASTQTTTETSTSSSERYYGSNIQVGGNTNMSAAQRIDVLGSQLGVSQDILLQAKTINIEAVAQNAQTSYSKETKSANAGVSTNGNVSVGVGQQNTDATSKSTTWAQSGINAGGTLTTRALDTTIRGAQVVANDLDIQSKTLLVASVQDSSSSESKSSGNNLGYGSSSKTTTGADGSTSTSKSGSITVGVNQQSSSSDSLTTNQVTRLIGRNSAKVQAYTTTIIGATVANADYQRDSAGNVVLDSKGQPVLQDKGQLDLRTNQLITQDLLDRSQSESSGFSINTGGSASITTTKDNSQGSNNLSNVTIGANRSGHDMQGSTLATMGGGQIRKIDSDEQVATTANRDVSKTQTVEHDWDTGGLNVSMTVDTRVFTQAGRASIAKDFKDSKEHVGDIGSAVVTAVTDDKLKITDIYRVSGDNVKTTQIANELKSTPEGRALLQKLGQGEGTQFLEGEQELFAKVQDKLGIPRTELNFYAKDQTTSTSLRDSTNADGSVNETKGATVKDRENSQYNNAYVAVTEDANKKDLTQTTGHEAYRTSQDTQDGRSVETRTALATNFGERLAMRLDDATDGQLSNTSAGFGERLLQTEIVKQGTLRANDVGSAAVEYRQLRLSEAQKLTQLKEGKTQAEKDRLNAAACALVRCADGVPDSDPNKAKLVAMQKAGAAYKSELSQLDSTGEFVYSSADPLRDTITRNGETIQRVKGGVNLASGALGTVAGGGIAVAGVLGCPETGVSCAAVPLGVGIAYASNQQAQDGLRDLTTSFKSTEGKRVLESFDVATYPGERDPLKEVGIEAGKAALITTIAKTTPKILAKAEDAMTSAQSANSTAAKVSYESISKFEAKGLNVTPELMQTSQAKELIAEYRAAGLSVDESMVYANGVLKTGQALPSVRTVSANEELIKIVPKTALGDDGVKITTPFFVTRSEYEALSKLNPAEIGQRLGLPAEQSVRGAQLGFEAYSITPKSGAELPRVFTSTIAPVEQGAYKATGGAQQTIVPNRSQWTEAKSIGSIGSIGVAK